MSLVNWVAALPCSKCSADLFGRSAAFRFKSSRNDRAKFATHLHAMLCGGTKNRGPKEQVRATLATVCD